MDVAQIVAALGDGSTESLPEPCKVPRGEIRVLFSNMSNVKLVVELVSIPRKSFSE